MIGNTERILEGRVQVQERGRVEGTEIVRERGVQEWGKVEGNTERVREGRERDRGRMEGMEIVREGRVQEKGMDEGMEFIRKRGVQERGRDCTSSPKFPIPRGCFPEDKWSESQRISCPVFYIPFPRGCPDSQRISGPISRG